MRDLPQGTVTFLFTDSFVSYLPAIVAERAGMAPRQLFCAAQPLEP